MIFRSMLKLSYSLEKNSASILVGNVMKPPRRATTSAKHAASEEKKKSYEESARFVKYLSMRHGRYREIRKRERERVKLQVSRS